MISDVSVSIINLSWNLVELGSSHFITSRQIELKIARTLKNSGKESITDDEIKNRINPCFRMLSLTPIRQC